MGAAVAGVAALVFSLRATTLKERADEAERQRMASQLKEAQNRADEAHAKLQPCTITPQQREAFLAVAVSMPKGPVEVNCVMGDGEARAFAMDIHALLIEAGWNIGPLTRTLYSGNPTGIIIAINNTIQAPPPYAELIADTLDDIGLSVKREMNKEIPPDGVRIVVGHKL